VSASVEVSAAWSAVERIGISELVDAERFASSDKTLGAASSRASFETCKYEPTRVASRAEAIIVFRALGFIIIGSLGKRK